MSIQYDVIECRRLIRRYALQASAAAAAFAIVPLPLGAAMDMAGFDPINPIQKRLVRDLCDHAGVDTAWISKKLETQGSSSTQLRIAAQLTRKLAVQGLERVAGTGVIRLLGRSAGRGVPLAASAIAGAIAARDTWQLGMRCLELAQIGTRRSKGSPTR